MYDFEKLYQAADIEDAINALEADPAAVVISGGSDVLIKIREGKLAGCSLVSIHGIKELKGITRTEDGAIRIRPATTFSEIANHPIIQAHIPVLAEAVDQVGGPQIRNIGTIGGNVCNGVTSADSASTLFALNAALTLTGRTGERTVPITEFYTGPGRTVREHSELLTMITITKENYEGYQGNYIKYAQRNAMDIATLGCSVVVKLTESKTEIADLRIAFGVAAPTPIRCRNAEELIKGRPITPELIQEFGKAVLAEVSPRDSWRASKALRLQIIETNSKRALARAITRCGGEADA